MAIPAVVLIAYLSFWAGSLLTYYIMDRLNYKRMKKFRSGSGTYIVGEGVSHIEISVIGQGGSGGGSGKDPK